MVHSLGIQTGSIRNIQAMRFLVHSQIFRPSSHSMIMCMTVSCCPQLEQRGEPASRMTCSRSFVGRMSWMNLNQLTLIESAAHVAWRFAHTRSQSVVGYIIVMRTFLGGFADSLILRSVSYSRSEGSRGFPLLGGFYICVVHGVYTQVFHHSWNPLHMGRVSPLCLYVPIAQPFDGYLSVTTTLHPCAL
jgi:hypothetical protein